MWCWMKVRIILANEMPSLAMVNIRGILSGGARGLAASLCKLRTRNSLPVDVDSDPCWTGYMLFPNLLCSGVCSWARFE